MWGVVTEMKCIRPVVLITAMSLSGCAGLLGPQGHEIDYKALVHSWMGSTEESLEKSWGEPQYSGSSGAYTVLTYDSRQLYQYGRMGWMTEGEVCYTTFYVDASGVIQKATWYAQSFHGNYDCGWRWGG